MVVGSVSVVEAWVDPSCGAGVVATTMVPEAPSSTSDRWLISRTAEGCRCQEFPMRGFGEGLEVGGVCSGSFAGVKCSYRAGWTIIVACPGGG